MVRRKTLAVVGLVGMVTVTLLCGSADVWGQEKKASGPRPWTLDEAIQQLNLYPRDAYLQYVALQLAQRENRTLEVSAQLQRVLASHRRSDGRFDCLVPVSGGKDGGYVSYCLKHKFGMHPLAITITVGAFDHIL